MTFICQVFGQVEAMYDDVVKKVLVFGTFDGVHEGHLAFLRQARARGDFLVVALARDEVVMFRG